MDKAQTKVLESKFAAMSVEQRRRFMENMRQLIPPPYLSKYCPKEISPKQEAFLSAPNLEILYGGAGGGGKTSAILIAALQYADQPNYDALILRRTFAELEMPGATISLSKKWLSGTDAQWRDGKYWKFPSGATLNFGYLARDDDRWQYGSANYNFIAFDEAAEFPNEITYTFLFSRLRRAEGVKIPPRMRLGANPIGPGAIWLKKRFISFPNADNLRDEPCFVCEHFHWREPCASIDCQCPCNPNSEPRLYIPAKLDDNPFIDKIAYMRSLAQLDPYTREAIANGNWNAKPPGKMFRREWFQPVDDVPHQEDVRRIRFWDLAATEEDKNKNPSWTCGVKMSYYRQRFYVEHVVRVRKTPGAVKEVVQQTALGDEEGTEIWIEQEPGSSGIAVISDYVTSLPQYVVKGFRASREKIYRAAPFASQAEAKNVMMRKGAWNEAYLDEMEQFPSTSSSVKNDQVDASSGAYNVLAEHPEMTMPAAEGERTNRPDWGESTNTPGERIRPDW